jgi:phosphoglucomutase
LWLNILAVRQQSVKQIAHEHWARFGRNYYTRHDYEDIDSAVAKDLMQALALRMRDLTGHELEGRLVATADDFSYLDPVDGSLSKNQGLRIVFEDGCRIVYRLSGTGTSGATLRVYIERFEGNPTRHGMETQAALADLILLADSLAGIRVRTGRLAPSVIT